MKAAKTVLSANWRPPHEVISGWFSSQSQCSKSVHYQINPEKLYVRRKRQMYEHNYTIFRDWDLKRAKCNRNSNLHSGKWNITTRNSSYNVNYESGDIDCELKLDEFLNVGVHWSSPTNNLYIRGHHQFKVEYQIATDSITKMHSWICPKFTWIMDSQ